MKLLESLGITDKRVRAIDIRNRDRQARHGDGGTAAGNEDATVLVSETRKYTVVEREVSVAEAAPCANLTLAHDDGSKDFNRAAKQIKALGKAMPNVRQFACPCGGRRTNGVL